MKFNMFHYREGTCSHITDPRHFDRLYSFPKGSYIRYKCMYDICYHKIKLDSISSRSCSC